MIYANTTAVLLDPADSEQIVIQKSNGSASDLSIRFGPSLSVLMTRKHAWDFLAQLADFLDDEIPCEKCDCSSTKTATEEQTFTYSWDGSNVRIIPAQETR